MLQLPRTWTKKKTAGDPSQSCGSVSVRALAVTTDAAAPEPCAFPAWTAVKNILSAHEETHLQKLGRNVGGDCP